MNPIEYKICARRGWIWSAMAALITLCHPFSCYADGPADALKCESPPAITNPAPAASSLPAKFEVKVDPDHIDPSTGNTVRVTNSGDTPVSNLYFFSLGLRDSKGRRTISVIPQEAKIQIAPGGWVNCKLELPYPRYAGTYTGTIQFAANGVVKSALGTTIKSRGPWQNSTPWLPFVLFVLVIIVGWLMSSVLNNWINNSLPRVQVAIALKETQSDLANFLQALGDWQKSNSAALPNTGAATACDKADVDLAIARIDTFPLDDLKQLAQTSGLSVRMNNELYGLLLYVSTTYQQGDIATKAHALDAVARTGGPSAYRAALLAALQSAAAMAPAVVQAKVPAGPLARLSTSILYRRIREMEWLHHIVVTIVVWLSAYAFFYDPNPAFGTFLDYSTVFLWALGLTQAGAQIVSSIRKP